MITINGTYLPNFITLEKEVCKSLKIGSGYLRKLEEKGLPHTRLDDLYIYDPSAVWKWYLDYKKNGGR